MFTTFMGITPTAENIGAYNGFSLDDCLQIISESLLEVTACNAFRCNFLYLPEN